MEIQNEYDIEFDPEVAEAIAERASSVAIDKFANQYVQNMESVLKSEATRIVREVMTKEEERKKQKILSDTRQMSEDYRIISKEIEHAVDGYESKDDVLYGRVKWIMEKLPFNYGYDKDVNEYKNLIDNILKIRRFERSIAGAEEIQKQFRDEDGERMMRVYRKMYIDGEKRAIKDIALEEGIEQRTAYRYLERAIKTIAMVMYMESV